MQASLGTTHRDSGRDGRTRGPTWSSVEATRVEELQGEMDVNVAEEHEDVAPLPGVGSDVQAPASGELLVHGDQRVVAEVLLSAHTHTHLRSLNTQP